jgi:Glycosyl hydrolase 36 superfamily, catalytic domain/Glycosyltransferase family 36
MRRVLLPCALAAFALCATAAPAFGLTGWPSVGISSSVGSGVFGKWFTDGFGLPSYRYTINEQRSPLARQPELAGSTDAWSQVGNDHIVANAMNHGYVELWSQDRRYEWTNHYDASADHFGGGYGYLRVGKRVLSTLYDDSPPGSHATRDFGVGYFHHSLSTAGISVSEYVYAPFGNDPVLLHDVTLRNETSRRRRVTWFEYWDVNPFDQATHAQIGIGPVRWLADEHALATTQLPTSLDRRPLTIFAAALRGPTESHAGDTRAFFGSGSRAAPASLTTGRLDGALAPGAAPGTVGRAMFAFSAPVVLAPHSSVTLRYAYGAVHTNQIAGLVRRYRRAKSPLARSERQWRDWLPQIALGSGRAWLSRELQWDAYTLRSGATYEDCRGRHIISQGGYYQYALGFQGAFRDPLQEILPLIYADPALARDVLLYSAEEQPRVGGQIPYAMSELCRPFKFGTSDDLDLWLLLAASEYGLATRDLHVFNLPVSYAGGGRGTLWSHLKLAFHHQQSLLGAHGAYLAEGNGDWSDLSTTFLGMTESTLVDAQAAYIYPRLALLADVRGDHVFAGQLRRAAAQDLRVTRGQWTARGWYARGYAGNRELGTGVIFGEPQPWAILAGAPSATQARTLVARIRRFLTGVGAPPAVHGPTRIGSSQSPAAADPGVTEHSQNPGGTGAGAAVFPGGSWYAINGWLTWALGRLGGTVPHARAYAFSELERNTLTAHATAYPDHWDGIISVDDVCHSFYSPTPADCGAGLTTEYEGQIMHQPAWSLFDALRLSGIDPVQSGFQIQPELPFHNFSLGFPDIGVAYRGATARGYVVTASKQNLSMEVAPPAGRRWRVTVNGRRTRVARRGGLLAFRLPTRPGRAATWTVAAVT